jgi:hypothetical protein
MKSKQLFFENLITQSALGGIPEGYNFADKTLYQIFEDLFSGTSFTEISLEDNAGLEFNPSSELRTKYNTLVADNVTSQSINKLTPKAASVWKTKTIVEVLDEILFPANLPTYTNPTITLAASPSPIYEVGESINVPFIVTGTKNDAGDFTYLGLFEGSTELTFSNPSPGPSATLNYTHSFDVAVGVTSWVGKGNYNQGARKSDSQGVLDTRPYAIRSTNNPQSADTNFTSNTVSIDGIYPFFYGTSTTKLTSSQIKSVIEAGNANKVLTKADGTISITFNASDKYIWFAHADVYPEKTKWADSVLNIPTDIGVTDSFINAPNLIQISSPDELWTTIDYLTYISDYSTNTVGALQFRNS